MVVVALADVEAVVDVEEAEEVVEVELPYSKFKLVSLAAKTLDMNQGRLMTNYFEVDVKPGNVVYQHGLDFEVAPSVPLLPSAPHQ